MHVINSFSNAQGKYLQPNATLIVILMHLLHETHKMSLHTRASYIKLLHHFDEIWLLTDTPRLSKCFFKKVKEIKIIKI
jgi:hypothetical protein